MADHVRNQIRDEVITDVTGLTTTSTRVYETHTYDLVGNSLPGLLVFCEKDEIDLVDGEDTMGTRRFMRDLSLIVEAWEDQGAVGNVQDTLDTICKEVENKIQTDPQINSKAKDARLVKTEWAYDDTTTPKVGKAKMTWNIRYRVEEGTSDVVAS
jgi:hypothetical protein